MSFTKENTLEYIKETRRKKQPVRVQEHAYQKIVEQRAEKAEQTTSKQFSPLLFDLSW